MSQLPVCSNPKVVLNVDAIAFIFRYKRYYIKGLLRYFRGRNCSFDYLKHLLSVKRNHVSIDDLDSSYAVNFSTGEIVPIYIAVPCGKCPNCELSKRWQHVFKCKLESQCYTSFPWFVTLTYNNHNLPFVRYSSEYRKPSVTSNNFDLPPIKSSGAFPTLCVRDVQLFLKRLRINLSRMFGGKYNFPIRYVCCGEYGKKGRPHYHLVIWGINTFHSNDFLNVASIIEHSWNKGFISFRLIQSNDDKCFRYTTKYLFKSSADSHMVDFRQKKPFLNSSKGKLGGIGKRFLIQSQDYMQRFFDDKLKYFNRFTGQAENVFFNNWSLNVLFPSFNRLVPSDVRRAVLEQSYYDSLHSVNDFVSGIVNVFRKYIFIPDWDDGVTISPKYSSSECSYIISKWLNSKELSWFDDLDSYLSDCLNKHRLRDKFIFQLTSSQSPVDLVSREYKSIQERNRMLSLQVL